MTHSEKFTSMVEFFGKEKCTPEQEMVVLLSSIASSLAAIADHLEEENNGI